MDDQRTLHTLKHESRSALRWCELLVCSRVKPAGSLSVLLLFCFTCLFRRMDRSQADRTDVIAAFVRICRHTDRMEVLRAILLRWPDITLDELCRGMKLGTGKPPASAQSTSRPCEDPT